MHWYRTKEVINTRRHSTKLLNVLS